MQTQRTQTCNDARVRISVGDEYEVTALSAVSGGVCLARIDDRTVFVTGAIPGESVRIAITSATQRGRVLRANVIRVLTASPHRVTPPCQHADVCGGCDWQHVERQHQLTLKREVLCDAMRRIGKFTHIAGVPLSEAIDVTAADDRGLGWRTRMRFSIDQEGFVGLRAARSHEIVPAHDCLLPVAPIRDAIPESVRNFGNELALIAAMDLDEVSLGAESTRRDVRARVRDFDFQVDINGFWQVHADAPEILVDAVLAAAEPVLGETVLDLYSGVGLFSRFLAEAVGPYGSVTAVEGDELAAELGRRNTADLPQIAHAPGDVAKVLTGLPGRNELIVLDPPRAGAGRDVIEALVQRRPRSIVYVSCDAATFARDARTLADGGFECRGVHGYDLFPMTKHLETVATFIPPGG